MVFPLSTRIVSAVITLTTASAVVSPANAQQQQQPNQQPIKAELLTRNIQIAAVTVCNLSKSKVAFDTALGASAAALSQFVISVHGGKVEGQSEVIPPDKLFNALSTDIAIYSTRICKNDLPAETVKQVEQILKAQQGQAGK